MDLTATNATAFACFRGALVKVSRRPCQSLAAPSLGTAALEISGLVRITAKLLHKPLRIATVIQKSRSQNTARQDFGRLLKDQTLNDAFQMMSHYN